MIDVPAADEAEFDPWADAPVIPAGMTPMVVMVPNDRVPQALAHQAALKQSMLQQHQQHHQHMQQFMSPMLAQQQQQVRPLHSVGSRPTAAVSSKGALQHREWFY